MKKLLLLISLIVTNTLVSFCQDKDIPKPNAAPESTSKSSKTKSSSVAGSSGNKIKHHKQKSKQISHGDPNEHKIDSIKSAKMKLQR